MPFARLPLLVLLGACGGSPTTPSGPVEDFPRVTAGSEARTGCPFPPGSSLYMVPGLSDHVVDPSAASLEARVTVGEERLYLNVEGYGCGSWYDPAWESTNPAAAPVTPLTGFSLSSACWRRMHLGRRASLRHSRSRAMATRTERPSPIVLQRLIA